MIKSLPVEKIKKAQLRYFDEEHNGVEIPEMKAYTIFIEADGSYINLFTGLDNYNVYERLPYTNTTQGGEDFGTKIRLVSGKEEDGVCYVLELKDMPELKGKETISDRELFDIVLKSEDFYFDRLDLLNAYPHLVGFFEKQAIKKKDKESLKKLFKYLDDREKEKVYKK